jgi:hypothetical protein
MKNELKLQHIFSSIPTDIKRYPISNSNLNHTRNMSSITNTATTSLPPSPAPILSLDGLAPSEPSINLRIRGDITASEIRKTLERAGFGKVDSVLRMFYADGNLRVRVHFTRWATGDGIDALRLAVVNGIRPRLYRRATSHNFWKISLSHSDKLSDAALPPIPRMELNLSNSSYAVIGSTIRQTATAPKL